MNAPNFEVKPYPEMWESLDMDVPRFDKARQMLGEVYSKIYLAQPHRPVKMAYFDDMISEIFGRRIQEMLDVKKEGKPIVGTFCVYVPEEVVVAAGGVCVGLCGFLIQKKSFPVIFVRWSSLLMDSRLVESAHTSRLLILFMGKQPVMPRKRRGKFLIG